MTISQQPTSPAARSNPFSGTSSGGGNLFNAKPARPPATEAEKATLKISLALYPCQPETPEGEAAYLDQLRVWQQVNVDSHVSRATGFPLHPGGAPPGSGECYNCRQTGHQSIDCQATGNKKIPQLEATFWAICGSILGQPSRHTAQVNYIAASENNEFAWLNIESTEQQGNMEGPSAL